VRNRREPESARVLLKEGPKDWYWRGKRGKGVQRRKMGREGRRLKRKGDGRSARSYAGKKKRGRGKCDSDQQIGGELVDTCKKGSLLETRTRFWYWGGERMSGWRGLLCSEPCLKKKGIGVLTASIYLGKNGKNFSMTIEGEGKVEEWENRARSRG